MKRITDILPKIPDWASVPYTADYMCPHCGKSGAKYGFHKPALTGWCDTPNGYMAVFECPDCFGKFRWHPCLERFDFEEFKDALELVYLDDKKISNRDELESLLT